MPGLSLVITSHASSDNSMHIFDLFPQQLSGVKKVPERRPPCRQGPVFFKGFHPKTFTVVVSIVRLNFESNRKLKVENETLIPVDNQTMSEVLLILTTTELDKPEYLILCPQCELVVDAMAVAAADDGNDGVAVAVDGNYDVVAAGGGSNDANKNTVKK